MNVFEFHEKYKISLAKARRIAKDNPRWFGGSNSAADDLRASLMKGNALTAVQLIDLLEHPSTLLELGKYAAHVEHALAALGNPQPAPIEVAANIMEAAKGEPEAVEILMGWLKEILAHGKPVNHAWIAVRLLLGVADTIRKFEAPRIPRALLNVRKRPEFAGYWHLEKSVSRNKTVYQKKGFDL